MKKNNILMSIILIIVSTCAVPSCRMSTTNYRTSIRQLREVVDQRMTRELTPAELEKVRLMWLNLRQDLMAASSATGSLANYFTLITVDEFDDVHWTINVLNDVVEKDDALIFRIRLAALDPKSGDRFLGTGIAAKSWSRSFLLEIIKSDQDSRSRRLLSLRAIGFSAGPEFGRALEPAQIKVIEDVCLQDPEWRVSLMAARVLVQVGHFSRQTGLDAADAVARRPAIPANDPTLIEIKRQIETWGQK